MASFDQGNVLPSALGTAITNAYTANTTSSAKYPAMARRVSVFFELTTLGGSGITDITVKLQASYDGNWTDIQSTRQDTGASQVEHVWNVGAAPQTAQLLVTTENARGALAGVRVLAKANASGSTGDVLEGNMTFS